MAIINYVDNMGNKNDRSDFLNISQREGDKLKEMVDSCKEFNEPIEINIYYGSSIDLIFDNRIKTEYKKLYGSKAFLPEELNEDVKEKICYCSHNKDFNETITTVFHESCHLIMRFDFSAFFNNSEEDKKFNLKNISFYIKYFISEFCANYCSLKLLLNFGEPFKEILCKRAINELIHDGEPLYKIFEHLFQFMGFYRGFQESQENKIKSTLKNKRKAFIYKYNMEYKELFNTLKSLKHLLDDKKENIKRLENEIFIILKDFISSSNL